MMSTSIHDQEQDENECVPRSHFFQVEQELYTLEDPKADPVYYDFKNPNTFLLTWSLHDIPRRS
jgi:hypothetical protein